MLNVLLKFFNKYMKIAIIFVQVLALVLAPIQYSQAMSEPFTAVSIKTLPIETSAGPVHVETHGFGIDNPEALAKAQQRILEITKNDPKSDHYFSSVVSTTEHKKSEMDKAVAGTVSEIEESISNTNNTKINPVVVNPPDKTSFFKKHYNHTLALVRFISNSSVVTTGLIVGQGISIDHAIYIGLLTGALSATAQLKNKSILNWYSNSVLLVKAAKKMGLLPNENNDNNNKAEKIITEVQKYGKWATIETGFLLVVQTAMSVLNIPVMESLALTVGKSVASQGIYDLGVLKLADEIKKTNPNLGPKVEVMKDVAIFSGSAIWALAAIGSMTGVPIANYLFVTLTAAGLVLNLSPWVTKLKPIDAILKNWRNKGAIISCRKLIEAI